MRRIASGVAALVALAWTGAAVAQQPWPNKTVRIVVPFTAGGTSDIMARAFAQKLSESWKEQVIVDNRPGAGTIIGSELVARAAPDGYTLLMAGAGHAVLPSMYRKLPFDPVADFAAVSQITRTYQILVAAPGVNVSSLKDVLALARSQSGKLNYGHAGQGTASHLVGEMFRLALGVPVEAIPYKGDSGVVQALITNQVEFAFMVPTNALAGTGNAKLKPIAVTGTRRGAAFPDIPTMAEAGLPDFEYSGWVGVLAPAATPREIVQKVSAEIVRILAIPDIAARVPGWGGEAAGTTPAEFAAKLRADVAKFAKVVKDAGIPPVQ